MFCLVFFVFFFVGPQSRCCWPTSWKTNIKGYLPKESLSPHQKPQCTSRILTQGSCFSLNSWLVSNFWITGNVQFIRNLNLISSKFCQPFVNFYYPPQFSKLPTEPLKYPSGSMLVTFSFTWVCSRLEPTVTWHTNCSALSPSEHTCDDGRSGDSFVLSPLVFSWLAALNPQPHI